MGVATLFLKFETSDILLTLSFLLVETSVLVVGTRSEEVAACSSALLTLLEPFQWASVFIPSIPHEYLDFVSSPVPFAAGVVAEDSLNLKQILNDYRVKDAMSDGMSILNLDTMSLLKTKTIVESIMSSSVSLVIIQYINSYQKRLKALSQEENSALLHFSKFVVQGCSVKESVTIQSLKRTIRSHFNSLVRLSYNDNEQKLYHDFDGDKSTFNQSKLDIYFKYQYRFLSKMSNTQMFTQFLETKKKSLTSVHLDSPSTIFIADWLSFKWKYMKKVNIVSRRNTIN